MYRNTLDCVRQTVRTEGIFAVYKGVGSPLVGLTLMNAALFLSFGQFKHFVHQHIHIGTVNTNIDPSGITIPQYF
ncbi:MAG: hypothetical protein CUN57_03605, partial [Phototrophicales bacterium]